ncbi:MAG: hypothetical protein KJ709_02650 [Nanoarchaeota archaeon]|nr:hypothetical protein [Nanoarchaeota archaeon]
MRLAFSADELKHLALSWAAISLAFAFLLDIGSLAASFMIAAATVGVGFIVHELSHKLLAQHYGCFAEFRANFSMLGLAVLLAAFAGIVFAAPGAVIIRGRATLPQYGKISLMGPLSSLVLALFFLNFYIFGVGTLKVIGWFGFYINSWLALFNLIPFGFFDGAKILRWSKVAYGFTVGFALLLFFGQIALTA